jgi:hypothetical protein
MKQRLLVIIYVLSTVYTIHAQEEVSPDSVITITHLVINYGFTSFDCNRSTLNKFYDNSPRYGAHNRVMVDFEYNSNSNAIPAQFAWSLLFKQDISNKLKDRGLKRIKNKVKFEDELKAGVSYTHYMPKKDIGVYFNYYHRNYRNIFFGKEAYELVFYGNARFENDTADLSGIRFQNFIYNQYTGGFRKRFDYGKTQVDFGVGVSFLQGVSQQDIRTDTAWIYTAPDGEFIDAGYNLSFNTAKEGATPLSQMNGGGASADLMLAVQQAGNWRAGLEISDVGAMYFRKNPVNYSAAKFVHFQGIVLPDLFSFSAQTFDTLNLSDTLKAYLPSKTTNDYRLFLPFSAQVYFSKSLLKNKLTLTAGLQYKFINQYKVYGYIKANYFHKQNVISASIGAGGYSLFNLGFEYARRWKYFDFALGSANLLGTLVPSHMPGASIYLRLGTSF